jgi:membrane protein YdbS with pleckstrin-like domain
MDHAGMDQESDDDGQVALKDAVTFALDEARMILPGIQALFGFQLVAVFNDRFNAIFDAFQQELHLAALVLVAISCALAMTPAAYHRQVERGQVSPRLLAVASGFVGAAMVPLMLAISIDVGLVAFAVTGRTPVSVLLALACGFLIGGLWLVYPRMAKRRHG